MVTLLSLPVYLVSVLPLNVNTTACAIAVPVTTHLYGENANTLLSGYVTELLPNADVLLISFCVYVQLLHYIYGQMYL